MATPKNVRSNTMQKHPKNTRLYIGIGIIVVALGITAWYFSDYWPWLSKERINERLEEVIDTCMNNERSLACKKIKERYNMSFKYCKSKTDGFDVSLYSTKPIYGVAWEGKSETPPESKIYFNGKWTTNWLSGYYGCTDH